MIQEFIDKYYLEPLKQDSGYNLVNTLTWAIIFVIAIILIYNHFFKKKNIEIDRDFMISLIGWIIFGSTLRIIRDMKLIETIFLVTPIIYIVVFIPTFLTLLIGLHLKNTMKIKLMHTWGLTSYTLSLINIIIIISRAETMNINGFLAVYAIWFPWFALITISSKLLSGRFPSNWNMIAIMSHMLDASGTFISMTYYGFIEKHVLGRTIIDFLETNNILLINGSGSWIMFALKLAVIPIALLVIDRYSETETEKKFLKMAIIILGLSIGIRNSLSVLLFS